jgi:hypothetical protein
VRPPPGIFGRLHLRRRCCAEYEQAEEQSPHGSQV